MTASAQRLVVVSAIVIAAVAAWVVVVGPARRDASMAQDTRERTERRADAVEDRVTAAERAVTRTSENARQLRRLGVAVPDGVEAPALVEQLDRVARRFGVAFDVLRVSDGAPTERGAARAGSASTARRAGATVRLSVRLSGSYAAVTRFVDAAQAGVRTARGTRVASASGRLLRVESIDLTADDGAGASTVAGDLSILAYALPTSASNGRSRP